MKHRPLGDGITKRLTTAALAFFVLVVASCATTAPAGNARDPRVTLTTDRLRYAPGDTVYVTLRNDGDRMVGYNVCDHTLQWHTGGGWVDVERFPPPGEMCPRNLPMLQAGKSVRVTLVAPLAAASGRYRATYAGGPSDARTSNEFVIGAP